MATVRDCKWTKSPDGSQTLTQCPLGEGMVDWPQFFGALAKANFVGPITLRVEYAAQDELAAVRKDLAFLKKQRAAAIRRLNGTGLVSALAEAMPSDCSATAIFFNASL